MPPTFDNTNARIRFDNGTVLTDRGRANADKRSKVVVEGVHLGLLPGGEAIDIGHGECSRRIKVRARRLDGDDKPRLLAEVWDHWHFVGMDERDTDRAAFAAVRERRRARYDR
jgi:hypothetical protein